MPFITQVYQYMNEHPVSILALEWFVSPLVCSVLFLYIDSLRVSLCIFLLVSIVDIGLDKHVSYFVTNSFSKSTLRQGMKNSSQIYLA